MKIGVVGLYAGLAKVEAIAAAGPTWPDDRTAP